MTLKAAIAWPFFFFDNRFDKWNGNLVKAIVLKDRAGSRFFDSKDVVKKIVSIIERMQL